MPTQTLPPLDAIVVGGSYAGLSAALQLARARRRVLVLDAGQPRNRFASHAHGVFAQDGRSGSALIAEAAAQLRRYPTVHLLAAQATAAQAVPGGFAVATGDGQHHTGRRLLLATGIQDHPPAIPGVAARWGRSVLHCPYCHGYEVGGGAIGVWGSSALAVHYAALVADWGTVTFFTEGRFTPDAAESARLAARGVQVEATPIAALEGPGTQLDGLRLQDGRFVPVQALFVGQQPTPASPLAAQLGCAFEAAPLDYVLRTDALKASSVPGVFAAGDMAQAFSNISLAIASGVVAGTALHRSLVEEAPGG